MIRRVTIASVAACALIVTLQVSPAAQTPKPQVFSTPEEAVESLITATKKGDLGALLVIFGRDGQELLDTSDPANARSNREVFSVAAAERWKLADDNAKRKTLVIGNEEWPFAVPLVKEGSGWHFDTAAGREEIIARRIGRNELATIDTCRAYSAAQRRYAQAGHDGKPAGLYAQKFSSDAGKENGLYWPAAHGRPRSPLGDLVAQAAQEGRPLGTKGEPPSPFHGYYFKILTGTGLLPMVAWPAQYDVTGVMTFLVGPDGVVHEKDLGPGTDGVARKMTAFHTDATWHPAHSE